MPEDKLPSFQFQVTFRGLVGLVPLPDNRYLLPLPDLLAGSSEELDERLPQPLLPHLACLVVPSKHVIDPEHAHLEFRENRPGREPQLLFNFRKDRLTLEYEGAGQGASAELTPLGADQSEPSDPGAPPATDLAWMPSLGRTGIPGSDLFNKKLVTNDLRPGQRQGFNRLIGTVVVDGGRLASSGVVVDNQGRTAIHRFGRAEVQNDETFSQAMFETVVWTGRVPGGGLTAVLARGPNRGAQRRIELQSVGGRLDMTVYNRELEEILNTGSGAPVEQADRDPDFAVGYWLSHAWEEVSGKLTVIPHSPAMGTGGSGEACKLGKQGGSG